MRSVKRTHQRLVGAKKGQQSEHEIEFREGLSKFKGALKTATQISAAVDRRIVEPRFGYATWIFTKLCLIGQSIILLVDYDQKLSRKRTYTLDHSSIAALARNVIESSLMFHYLAEKSITNEQWTLRKRVLDLHDCLTRHRVLKAFPTEDRKEDPRSIINELRDRLRQNETFKTLPDEKQELLLRGQTIYVDGLRAAARTAGWDIEEFDSVYAYLSSHSHSSPMSFYRMDEDRIDFAKPTDFQFVLATYSLAHSHNAFVRATARFGEVFPDAVASVSGQ